MKKILISLMTLVLVLGLVGAGAFAYFSDTEKSEGNTFTAGTLDLEITSGPGSSSVTFDNMAPGESVSGSITVKNMGSTAGWLYGRTTYTNIIVDISPETAGDLADVLIVTSWLDPEMTLPSGPDMTLKAFADQGWQSYGSLTALGHGAASGTFTMTVTFDPNADNTYQKQGVNVTFEFLLTGDPSAAP